MYASEGDVTLEDTACGVTAGCRGAVDGLLLKRMLDCDAGQQILPSWSFLHTALLYCAVLSSDTHVLSVVVSY